MSKKVGLPDFIKSRHTDTHLVDEISARTRTAIIRHIPINKIIPNMLQPRKDMGDLTELAKSIKEKGIIEPIIVRTRDGKFEIIAGERRYKAAEIAGLNEVPCIEHDVPDNEALEMAIIENLQRKDLNIFESAYSLKSLAEIYGYTHEDIANKIGKSRVTVSELLRITDLPSDIVQKCLELNITAKTFLLELVKLNDKEKMLRVLEQYSEKPFSRDSIKQQRKEKESRSDKPINQMRNFKFISTDKSVKINFKIRSEEFNKEKIIKTLEQLIDDIKSGNLKEFK